MNNNGLSRMEFDAEGNCVPCRPFPKAATELRRRPSGLVGHAQKVELLPLEVCFSRMGDGLTVALGDVVYVRATRAIEGWAKEVMTIEGLQDPDDPAAALEFILVPVTEVVLVRRGE